MKYSIEGIEKGKTIKSVQIVKGKKKDRGYIEETPTTIDLIMVNYLDGTQDVFELNEETLKRIQNMVDTQAKTFLDKQDVKFPVNIGLMISVGLSIFFGAILCPVAILADVQILAGIIFALISAMCATNAIRLKFKNDSIKKHKTYVSKIMGKLEEYNEILRKENALSKEVNKELVDVINIDNKSIKELEQIGNKIERYNEIEGKSPKKKTL